MHTDALKKMVFFIWDLLNDELKSVIEVIGEYFDSIETDFQFILTQIDVYQATITGSLTDFERFYICIPSGGDTEDDRRNRVLSRIRLKGGYNTEKFESVAEGLGYTIGPTGSKHLEFSEGDYNPFRADYGQADIDAVWDQDGGYSLFTIVVTGTDVETDDDLQTSFNRMHCAGTNFIYSNS